MMPFSDEEIFEASSIIFKNKIIPFVQKDGGDISIDRVENGKIYVKFQGACVGCSSKSSTLSHVVEKEIKSLIHPDIEVLEV
jgi:Fe-S cluster biogenesis protein NfuA